DADDPATDHHGVRARRQACITGNGLGQGHHEWISIGSDLAMTGRKPRYAFAPIDNIMHIIGNCVHLIEEIRAARPTIPASEEPHMPPLRPKFITFDCYGTLSRPLFNDMAREIYGRQLAQGQLDQFLRDFSGYRFDEVLGAWKPYRDVIINAAARTCRRHG